MSAPGSPKQASFAPPPLLQVPSELVATERPKGSPVGNPSSGTSGLLDVVRSSLGRASAQTIAIGEAAVSTLSSGASGVSQSALSGSFGSRSRSPSASRTASARRDARFLKLSALNKMGSRRMVHKESAEKIICMARGARRELNDFAKTTRPKLDGCLGVLLYAAFLLWCPLIARIAPRSFRGFYTTLARCGGESRVRMLLKIATIDSDQDGELSDEEVKTFERSKLQAPYGTLMVLSDVGHVCLPRH